MILVLLERILVAADEQPYYDVLLILLDDRVAYTFASAKGNPKLNSPGFAFPIAEAGGNTLGPAIGTWRCPPLEPARMLVVIKAIRSDSILVGPVGRHP